MTDPRDTDAVLLRSSGRKAEAAALAVRNKVRLDPLQEMMGLPAPVWENQPDSKVTDGQCVIFSGPVRCRGDASHRVWIGCTTGEHLDYSDVCGAHALHLEAWKGHYNCRRCWDALNVISKAQVIKIERIDDAEHE